MARIYTRSGDDGTTGLLGGERVTKDSPRVEAYGEVDELNAVLGAAASFSEDSQLGELLRRVQHRLFVLGANLALPSGAAGEALGIPPVGARETSFLEEAINEVEVGLPELRRFILPGGGRVGALLHLARTVARRAERRCVALAEGETVDPEIIRYLNRLSDLLFVLARQANQREGRTERHADVRAD